MNQMNIIEYVPEEGREEKPDAVQSTAAEEQSTELVAVASLVPAVIFKEGGADPVIEKIEEQARSVVLDVSTEKGRKEIASLAYRIARSKTALDEMGKELGDDLRKKKDAIDSERRKVRSRLEALQDEIRKPLTEFEGKEKSRIAAHELAIEEITATTIFKDQYGSPYNPDQTALRDRIAKANSLNERDWEEFSTRAEVTVAHILGHLKTKLEFRAEQDAKDAELARLKAAEEERLQKEREDRIAAEAAAEAKRAAEEKAAADAKAAQEKADREKAEIESQKREADARAKKAEEDRIAAEKKAEADRVAAAEQSKRDADAAAQRERDKIAAEEKAKADEQARRDADMKHRRKINNEAKVAIIKVGGMIDAEDLAQAIVAGIAAGKIPNVKIIY